MSCLSVYIWTSWSKINMDKGAHRANGHKGPDHSVDSVVLWPSTSILPDTEAANRVFSSDSYSEAYPLNVMVVGGEAPGRRSGERGEAL